MRHGLFEKCSAQNAGRAFRMPSCYSRAMKYLLLIFVIGFSQLTLADDMEVKSLSCRAYNLLGHSSFELTENSEDMVARTYSMFGYTTSSYRYTGVDAKSTFGTTDIPFSKITFINNEGLSYLLIFTEPLEEGKTSYSGTWGQVSSLSPFGGPAGYTYIASVKCSIEVVEQPY